MWEWCLSGRIKRALHMAGEARRICDYVIISISMKSCFHEELSLRFKNVCLFKVFTSFWLFDIV